MHVQICMDKTTDAFNTYGALYMYTLLQNVRAPNARPSKVDVGQDFCPAVISLHLRLGKASSHRELSLVQDIPPVHIRMVCIDILRTHVQLYVHRIISRPRA